MPGLAIVRYWLLVSLAVHVPLSAAQDVAPDALLKALTADVITVIKQGNDQPRSTPMKIADLVETKILPHFDFNRMTRIAVGRNWGAATPEQQKALTAEFQTLLVRTYSAALTSYRGQAIEFRPLRTAPGDSDVTVKSVLKQAGAAPLTMDYDMAKTLTGWKVYEIKVDGINLIANYRETFAAKVHAGGVAGLIKALADKNRASDVPTPRSTSCSECLPAYLTVSYLLGQHSPF